MEFFSAWLVAGDRSLRLRAAEVVGRLQPWGADCCPGVLLTLAPYGPEALRTDETSAQTPNAPSLPPAAEGNVYSEEGKEEAQGLHRAEALEERAEAF